METTLFSAYTSVFLEFLGPIIEQYRVTTSTNPSKFWRNNLWTLSMRLAEKLIFLFIGIQEHQQYTVIPTLVGPGFCISRSLVLVE